MTHEKYYQEFLNSNIYPRQLKNLDISEDASSMYIYHDKKKLINFSSSDYLNLAKHPLLIARSHDYAKRYGVGLSSSRLVTGNYSFFAELENKIAKALNKPAALILGTGYQTNISILDSLLDKTILKQEPLVFCDRHAHVSMIATTRYLTRLIRFQHNNLNHLQELLKKYANSNQPKFILVESVYSMDGDITDLEALTQLANDHQAFLYVDDAHAVGVYGWGKTVTFAKNIDLIMGTFSKALGSFGAYIACSETLRDYFINRCKGMIYSTGLSPAMAGAIDAAIELLPTLDKASQAVLQRANLLREFFTKNNLDFGNSTSHIVPWIIGDAALTLRVGQLLEEGGILGVAIQPPSVPANQSRIRFCLTAAHTDNDLECLMRAIKKIIK